MAMSYSSAFFNVFHRQFKLAWQKPAQIFQPVFLFLVVVTLFPLGVSPAPQLLQEIGVGVIWIAAILSIMMSVDGLFKQEYLDGTLESWLTSSIPMSWLILAKLVATWLISCLVLIVMTPLLAMLMSVPSEVVGSLVISLLIGTPTLLFVGAIGNALTVSLNQAGVLLSLLILPLYIPVLIFATSMLEAAKFNADVSGHIAILLSMLLMSCLLAPFAIAAALKNTVN